MLAVDRSSTTHDVDVTVDINICRTVIEQHGTYSNITSGNNALVQWLNLAIKMSILPLSASVPWFILANLKKPIEEIVFS